MLLPSTTTPETFRLVPLGDAALTVELGNKIDPAVNDVVISFADLVRAQAWEGVMDVVPTYRSITIHFDPHGLDIDKLSNKLLELRRSTEQLTAPSGTQQHTIPVLYGEEWGPDLKDVASFGNLSITEAILLHSSVTYRVFMLGFSPGFPYLGLVPAPITMPRLTAPRLKVPAGSIGIAGEQTGVYPTATPGGWRIIGRTPVTLYRPTKVSPFLLQAGDLVRFQPITREEYNQLERDRDADTR